MSFFKNNFKGKLETLYEVYGPDPADIPEYPTEKSYILDQYGDEIENWIMANDEDIGVKEIHWDKAQVKEYRFGRGSPEEISIPVTYNDGETIVMDIPFEEIGYGRVEPDDKPSDNYDYNSTFGDPMGEW